MDFFIITNSYQSNSSNSWSNTRMRTNSYFIIPVVWWEARFLRWRLRIGMVSKLVHVCQQRVWVQGYCKHVAQNIHDQRIPKTYLGTVRFVTFHSQLVLTTNTAYQSNSRPKYTLPKIRRVCYVSGGFLIQLSDSLAHPVMKMFIAHMFPCMRALDASGLAKNM